MNVLITASLEDHHVQQIKSVSDEVEVIQTSSEGQLLEVIPEVDVAFGGVRRDMFPQARRLRWIQLTSAGVDGALYPELVESDVTLTSAKGVVGVHLAEHAMALLLALTRRIGWAVRKPSWDQRSRIRSASWELVDRTMGIVGLGGTGRELAIRASGFGMRITAVDPEPIEVPAFVDACWRMDRFHDLLAESDVVAICAPLTAETRGLFNRQAFRRMRPHALLINVTRGKIVDGPALMEALEQGLIGGAGLDVTPDEPLPEDHPLWQMENAIVTPHTAGGSPNRMGRTVELFCENLGRMLEGKPLLSVIDKRKGY